MEFVRTPTQGKGIPQKVKRVCWLPNEVNRRRGEPACRRIVVYQAVDLGKQVMVNFVRSPSRGIGRLHEVFY